MTSRWPAIACRNLSPARAAHMISAALYRLKRVTRFGPDILLVLTSVLNGHSTIVVADVELADVVRAVLVNCDSAWRKTLWNATEANRVVRYSPLRWDYGVWKTLSTGHPERPRFPRSSSTFTCGVAGLNVVLMRPISCGPWRPLR